VQICYLGPLEVRADGQVLDVPGQRLRRLLLRLAVDAGRPVSTAELARAVWDDEQPVDPANSLQSLVSRLRRTLGGPEHVEQVGPGYRLVVEPDDVDAVQFTRQAADGRRLLVAGSYDDAADLLREALALWRGQALVDDRTSDADPERARLDELRLQALHDRVAADLRLGRATEVVPELEALTAAHPAREDLTLLLMDALVAADRPADALAAYQRTRELLVDTFGTDPSPALQDKHLEVLRLEGSGSAPRTNLRATMTSFVGREGEVRAVTERLGTGRLVTLVGAGGSGKTRLATEVAAGLLPDVPDGVWFVELAPVSDADNIALAALDGLGVRDVAQLEQPGERPRREARARVLETLVDATCLLVVDNCEHVVDAAASLVADILGRCPGVRVLATSREPLGVDGETLFPLSPLTLPAGDARPEQAAANAAVRLLLDRARAVGAEVDLATSLGPVVEIVRRLDGLPLAIELAAARLRVLTPEEVADRLADRFRLLTGGRRTAMPRHRTLRAVVEWSWELLTATEREVAEHFCVFGAGATTEAVAAVSGAIDVLDTLLALVDKSLLVAERTEDGTRFRMLETLREYGAEQLTEGGAIEAARDAHARYYAGLAHRADRKLRTRQQLVSLRTLDTERENVLAALGYLGDSGDAAGALDLAVDLGWYWVLRENGEDAIRWLGFALAVPGADLLPQHAVAAALQMVMAVASPQEGKDAQSRRADLIACADRLRSPESAYHPARVLRPLLLFFGEQREAALSDLEQVLLHDEDPWARATARSIRLAFAENDGDLDTMRADVAVGLAEWEAIGDRWGLAALLTSRAQLRTLDGDLLGAATDLELAQRHRRELGGSTDDLMVAMRLADLRLRAGDTDGARRHLATMREHGSLGLAEQLRSVLAGVTAGAIAVADGDRTEMLAARDRLLADLTDSGEPDSFRAHAGAVGWAAAGSLDLQLGDGDQALAHVCEGYRLAVATNDLPILASVGLNVAELAVHHGLHRDAAEVLGASARLRGADDPTHPLTVSLTATLRAALGAAFAPAYAGGQAMSRSEAVSRLDPATLGVVGASTAGQVRRR
jgi:predicted ATPase/DNA-binding SARP family transcriptional activator